MARVGASRVRGARVLRAGYGKRGERHKDDWEPERESRPRSEQELERRSGGDLRDECGGVVGGRPGLVSEVCDGRLNSRLVRLCGWVGNGGHVL